MKNNVGPNGEDAVMEITKNPFLPQTPEHFTHDADGNLTSDARWIYTWDAENRLIEMVGHVSDVASGSVVPNAPPPVRLEFAYDGQSRRIAKNVYNWNGTTWELASEQRFLYEGWNMIAALHWNASTSTYDLNSSFVWGLDLSGSLQGAGGVGGLLAVSLSNGSTHASAFDGNGNVIGLVDMATGTKSVTYDYNAFGETIQSDGVAAAENPFRFSTKYTDHETDLLYYGFRYYNPSTGRWPSRDPIQESGGVNLYGFVGNNPVSNLDSLGQYSFASDDSSCTINLHFKLQLFFETRLSDQTEMHYGSEWTDIEKQQYATNIKRAIEDAWNNGSLRIYPKNECCKCFKNGYRPTVNIETKIEGWWWDDVEASVIKNTESDFFRSHAGKDEAALSVFDVKIRQGRKDHQRGKYQQQMVSAHEFGHMIGIDHPSAGMPGVEKNSNGEYMDRDKPAWMRDWGLPSESIMGGGMELRGEHFQQWLDALNAQNTKCGPYEIR